MRLAIISIIISINSSLFSALSKFYLGWKKVDNIIQLSKKARRHQPHSSSYCLWWSNYSRNFAVRFNSCTYVHFFAHVSADYSTIKQDKRRISKKHSSILIIIITTHHSAMLDRVVHMAQLSAALMMIHTALYGVEVAAGGKEGGWK